MPSWPADQSCTIRFIFAAPIFPTLSVIFDTPNTAHVLDTVIYTVIDTVISNLYLIHAHLQMARMLLEECIQIMIMISKKGSALFVLLIMAFLLDKNF